MKSIRRLRLERGLSIRRPAKKAGFHWTTIRKIEKAGRITSFITLNKLAKAPRVSLSDLLTGSPQ